jgi:type II secretory pathway component GspD/PulD (secretin)
MRVCPTALQNRTMYFARMFAFLSLSALCTVPASAQPQAATASNSETKAASETYRTLYLTNITRSTDAMSIVTDLRNLLPKAKIYYVEPRNAISLLGSAEDLQLAEKVIADMSRSSNVYRLTYKITDLDQGQRVGSRQVSFIIACGKASSFKQGEKIPVVTGREGKDFSNEQVQYLDVGLNIDALLEGPSDDLRLWTKVEQSSVSADKSTIGVMDPLVDQTVLQGDLILKQGQSMVLGSLDGRGGMHHQEIEVSAELVQ